jgi:hypothetical protein
MSTIKGLLGEDRVSYILESRLEKPEYRIGNNVILLTDEGKSVQFDHIVISIYGIFVIETKNCKGTIVGHELDKYWQQLTSGKSYKMYNPIHQNYGHIQQLKVLLSPDIEVQSIVCFTERAQLQIEGHRTPVVYPFGLIGVIESYKAVVFTVEQVDYMIDKIRKHVILYRQSKRDHIGNVLEGLDRAKATSAHNNNLDIFYNL